ncbi:MAG: helix-turn-helix domain-containing protein [Planctomycetota bacterium]
MGRKKNIEDHELLEAARAVFVKRGFAGTTREIARRAGISEAVIYQRHSTKAHLFFAAMTPPEPDFAKLLEPPADPRRAREHFGDLAVGMVNYFRKLVPIFLPLLTHPSFDFAKYSRQREHGPFGRIHAGFTEYLEKQRKRGLVAAPNLHAAALTLFAALHFLAIMEKLGVHGGRFPDAGVRAIAKAMWEGLAPRTRQA